MDENFLVMIFIMGCMFLITCILCLMFIGLVSIESAIINKRHTDELIQHMNRISEIIIEFEATEGNVYDTNKVAETIGKISAHIKREELL